MSTKEIKSNILSNYYVFESFGCECLINTNIDSGNNVVYIKTNKTKKHTYAFTPEHGLVKIGENGAVINKNIIGDLINTLDNPEGIRDFFNDNCFFIQFSDYIETDYKSIFKIVYCIKITIDLMKELSENKKDYIKILELVISRLLISNMGVSASLSHKLNDYNLFEIIDNITDIIDKNSKSIFEKNKFYVHNGIENKDDEIDIDFYNKINSGFFEGDEFYNKIVFAYCNYTKDDIYKRIINIIKNISETYGHIDIVNGCISITNQKKNCSITNNTQIAIINIAKEIIKNDINKNVSGIHPEYNYDSTIPNWKIDDFLSAIFFSIFYINPELQIYRKCANIHCNRYFLVDTSSRRKKYCSNECRNLANVNKFRQKHNKK